MNLAQDEYPPDREGSDCGGKTGMPWPWSK